MSGFLPTGVGHACCCPDCLIVFDPFDCCLVGNPNAIPCYDPETIVMNSSRDVGPIWDWEVLNEDPLSDSWSNPRGGHWWKGKSTQPLYNLMDGDPCDDGALYELTGEGELWSHVGWPDDIGVEVMLDTVDENAKTRFRILVALMHTNVDGADAWEGDCLIAEFYTGQVTPENIPSEVSLICRSHGTETVILTKTFGPLGPDARYGHTFWARYLKDGPQLCAGITNLGEESVSDSYLEAFAAIGKLDLDLAEVTFYQDGYKVGIGTASTAATYPGTQWDNVRIRRLDRRGPYPHDDWKQIPNPCYACMCLCEEKDGEGTVTARYQYPYDLKLRCEFSFMEISYEIWQQGGLLCNSQQEDLDPENLPDDGPWTDAQSVIHANWVDEFHLQWAENSLGGVKGWTCDQKPVECSPLEMTYQPVVGCSDDQTLGIYFNFYAWDDSTETFVYSGVLGDTHLLQAPSMLWRYQHVCKPLDIRWMLDGRCTQQAQMVWPCGGVDSLSEHYYAVVAKMVLTPW